MADKITQLYPGNPPLPELKACPACRRVANPIHLTCRGFGPPPCWQVVCDNCGAAGPCGYGFTRGDDNRARIEAVNKWNELPRSQEPA